MIAMSVVGIVVFIAGLTASRQVAQAITTAASNASALAQGGSGQAVVVLPAVPWWQTALSSAVALGSFAATAFLALRNHPVTRRIEELELRIKRRTKEASKAVRPLGAATAVSSRNLALLDAAMAELGSRLDITQDIGIVPAFARICTDIDQLHERQRVCVEAFDAASDPTPLELDSSDSAPGGDATSGAEQPDVIDLAGDGRLVRPAVSASNSGTTR